MDSIEWSLREIGRASAGHPRRGSDILEIIGDRRQRACVQRTLPRCLSRPSQVAVWLAQAIKAAPEATQPAAYRDCPLSLKLSIASVTVTFRRVFWDANHCD